MTNSEARKRDQENRPCPTCSGPSRETVGMVCQTCGIDYAPHPAMAAAVEVFSAAWEEANERGWSGHRVEAGLRALLLVGWTAPLLCGCGHALSDHANDQTGACMVQVTDRGEFCSCISVWAEPC